MSDTTSGGDDFSTFDAGPGGPAGEVDGTPAGGDRASRFRRPRVLAAVAGAIAVILVVAGIMYAVGRSVEPGFDNPEAIAELLDERGAPCAGFSDDGGEGRAEKRGTCAVDGEKIIIATFDSREEVEAHWERQLQVATDNQTIGMVIGDKWTISGTARAYLRHAAEVLDAEYRNN